jgi:hypothetical protein
MQDLRFIFLQADLARAPRNIHTKPDAHMERGLSCQANSERDHGMCLLRIHARSYGKISEVLPEEVEHTELTVEDAVSRVLLALFGEVTVDDVTVRFSPSSPAPGGDQRECSIQVQAQCTYESCVLLPCTQGYMKLAIGKSISSVLKELFASVQVESVVVQSSTVQSRK